jgi:hypothetical protein
MSKKDRVPASVFAVTIPWELGTRAGALSPPEEHPKKPMENTARTASAGSQL